MKLAALVLLALWARRSAAVETLTIYTRDSLSDTVLARINPCQNINAATSSLEVAIGGFQNVFDIEDLGAYDFEFQVTRRKARHIGFCLLKKGDKNPLTTPVGEKFKLDFWKVDCDVIDAKATLQLSDTVFMKKPEGS